MEQQEATIVETLSMLRQHESKYETRDPLHREGRPSHPAGPLHIEADQECRAKMAAWCFQVAKFCKFQLESIEIALSCFDRFLTTEQGAAALQDRSTYQLACMVCLYTAVKVHERTAISPAIVAALARDAYTTSDVEAMERTILIALQWRVHPPTMASFARLGVDLASQQSELTEQQHTTIKDLCSYQLEMAVKEYRFVTVDRSIVAFCAVMNSLDAVGVPVTRKLSSALALAMQLHSCQDLVMSVSGALYVAVLDHQDEFAMLKSRPVTPTQQADETKTISGLASLEESPRSVASQSQITSHNTA